ncbi:hypothetical protein AAFC00_007022 [Neodothiora populina]|uniref:Splicing factor U2AF subunit n=1 Tax=Neodothiora populina TaxID=2781224 RepID=A0ABR3PCJ3_9PEZI
MNGDSYSSRDRDRHASSRDHYSSRDDRRGGGGGRDRDGGDRPRRRSRSPGHRNSRRDYEVDSYSSSRDYREREREERYTRGDRHGGGRGEREWDRDRAAPRRDRDDRPPRRDRDLFDDRRGGGGGGRGGGRERERERDPAPVRRSPSPPKKPKEPTPDLTDVPSVLERKRRLTQWDIKPPGYENVTAEQAKLSGMFPLPGAPRQQPMDPTRLAGLLNQPANTAANTALKPSHARQSKRLFVYNVPPTATDDSLCEFFNLQLNGLNVTKATDPCLSAMINAERTFALLEFKAAEDATTALALDGISVDSESTNGDANGKPAGLSIRRPKDYIVPAVTDESEQTDGVVSENVPDTQNKVRMTNIPVYIEDEQVKELLQTFGQLKSCIVVKDTSSGQSRGIAFFEYVDPSVTDSAVTGLNGIELGDGNLIAARAAVGVQQVSGEMSVNAMSMLAGAQSTDVEQGRVLCLLNMVTPEELYDNDEYEEIMEDVKEECEKYGSVLDTKIPRPTGGSRQSNGVGKIYVKYDTPEAAQKALQALAGRKFADRTVVVTFFGEEYFDINAW